MLRPRLHRRMYGQWCDERGYEGGSCGQNLGSDAVRNPGCIDTAFEYACSSSLVRTHVQPSGGRWSACMATRLSKERREAISLVSDKYRNVFYHSSGKISHPAAPPKSTRFDAFNQLWLQHHNVNCFTKKLDSL
jgi:hypothetical protein